jgi:peptide/nickel transport system ATP-binding protein
VADGHEVACIRVGQLESVDHMSAKTSSLPAHTNTQEVLLELDKVTISYGGSRRFLTKWFGAEALPTVPSITFSIRRGEILALVGESGSGKSTIAKAISGLIKPDAGEIKFEGEAIAGNVGDRPIDLRREIQFVFQNPDASLNPRKRIGAIVGRHMEYFRLDMGSAANDAVLRSLADVRLDKSYAGRFPDQLSGGERQRVAIARALAVNPSLILCDEVLSALDVSVQASIVDLLMQLRADHQVALLFISHDLAVVKNLADRVGVLYRGQLMEFGSNAAIF